MEITISPTRYFTKGKCFTIITLVFLIFLQTEGLSQTNPELGFPLITNYSPKDYKGHGQVWGVIQGENGVMYFGTSAGITEYDGVNWRQIGKSKSKGIQTIRAFGKDKNGKIYFCGGENFGYLEIDPFGNSKAISLIGIIPEEYKNFSDMRSLQIIGEYIFVQSKEYLFRFDVNTEKADRGIKVWKAETYFIYSINLGGELYLFQPDKGLYKLNEDKIEMVAGSESLRSTKAYIMLPLPEDQFGKGQYLLGTSNDGFYRYTGSEFIRYKTEIDQKIFNNFLYRGMVLSDGNFLVSVIGEGLFVISPQGKLILQVNYSSGLQDESVYFPYLDSAGMLWLGLDNGITKVELRSSITIFSKQTGLKTGVLSLERVGDKLFIGTPIGMTVLNGAKKEFETGEFGGAVQVFDMLGNGDDLLFATLNGMALLNSDLKLEYEFKDDRYLALVFLGSRHIKNRVYVGNSFGLSVIKKSENNGKWEREGYFPGNFFEVWTLAESKEGDIWAGTQSGVAYRITPKLNETGGLDFENSKTEIFSQGSGKKAGYGHGLIYGVAGKIFAPSEQGLSSYNPESGNFEMDRTFGDIKMDFSSTENFSMVEDKKGRVWIANKNKILLATPKTDGTYEIEDNLFNAYPWEDIITIFPEEDGTVWVAGGDGLVRMEEKGLKSSLNQFSTLLRQAITKTDTLSLDSGEGISLKQSNNSLRFMYAAPFFEQEDRTVYQTYLEGFDPEWTDWGTNSYKEYTNLATGTYSFRVRAKNLYNVISEEATFTFTILPPWYATWWAFLLYSVGVAGIGYLIYLSQKKRLIANEREKSRERELAQAKEIEKAYENLKATQEQLIQQEKLASLGQLTAGIAHEIKNPLNFVNNFSELSLEYVDEISESVGKLGQNETTEDIKALLGDVKGNLTKILQHGSRADGIVRSMLMHSRGGKGIKELTDLNELIKEYVNLAFHGMRANKNPINVDIKVQLEESLPKVMLNPEDFSRVILNLCKNAFDAMRDKTEVIGKDYLPRLLVNTKNLDDSVMLVVEDNGPGVADEIKDKLLMPFFTTKKGTEGTGLGLSITYDIVKDHGGVLEIDSIVGEYTRFIILIPKTQ